MNRRPVDILMVVLVFATASFLQADDEATKLAKETQNPVADLISIPFQDNINFRIGPDRKNQNILNIQPVIPVSLNDNWNLITRTILPVISNPWPQPKNGIGDVLESLFVSPTKPQDGIIWGAGPALSFPTGSDPTLSSGKWGAGPSLVVAQIKEKWVYGILANNVWSYAGHEDRAATSAMTLQPFINYNLGKGAVLTTVPVMTANWKATDASNRWTVPVGGGIGKLFFLGKLPVNTSVQYYNNIIRTDTGPLWTLRLQFQILLPKGIFAGRKAG